MMPVPDCSFVLSVEQGKLESQAVLLVESLRRFGGAYANCPVYAVSPRPTRQMGMACRRALTELGAQTVTDDLMPADEIYGPVGRMAVCAWAERNLRSEIIVGLDDDLFFAGEPDFSLQGADFFARPVDAKGMCTAGPGDPFDVYWRQIAQLAGVDYDEIPWVETTADHISIKASYNAGMIAVRREAGLFRRTQEIFDLIQKNNLPPYQAGEGDIFSSTGFVGIQASQWWGSSQAVFSLAATEQKAIRLIAPVTYNVPAHLIEYARWLGSEVTLKDAVLVHYHWLLHEDTLDDSPIFHDTSGLSPLMVEWLKSKTPLRENNL
jgi:hypothetical protein